MLPSGSIPLFSAKYNAPDTVVILRKTYPPVPLPVFSRLASFYQAVKVLTSPRSPPYTHHQGTQHGQEKIPNSIMIIIIIIISIR